MKSKLALVLLLLIGHPAFAQESSMDTKKPWWNPFATPTSDSAPKERDSSFFNSTGGTRSSFELPKWNWPSVSLNPWSQKDSSVGEMEAAASSAKSKQPSALSRFGSASKKFWSDTVDFVNPFDRPKKAPKQGYRPQDLEEQRSKSGIFSWFSSRPEKQEFEDVNGFLSQPRPRF